MSDDVRCAPQAAQTAARCAQALGKHYNTEELIQQLGSTKPMADIWKSGIEHTPHGYASGSFTPVTCH